MATGRPQFRAGGEGAAHDDLCLPPVGLQFDPASDRCGHWFDDDAVVKRDETIEVRTLDDICPDLSEPTLLKIDTQGHECHVLEGARGVPPGMAAVLMELPIIHLYQDNWQFHEAVAFMAGAGFVPAQIHPVNYHLADDVSLVEVDCPFRPRDERLDAGPNRAAAG